MAMTSQLHIFSPSCKCSVRSGKFALNVEVKFFKFKYRVVQKTLARLCELASSAPAFISESAWPLCRWLHVCNPTSHPWGSNDAGP